MSLDSEEAVMKKLGVDSFENLTDEQVIELGLILEAASMSDELRAKIIASVPLLKELLVEGLEASERVAVKGIDARGKEAELVHAAYSQAREMIKGRVERGDLSEDAELYLIEKAIETADKERDFAAENGAASERAQERVDAATWKYGVLAAVTIVAISGVRIIAQRRG